MAYKLTAFFRGMHSHKWISAAIVTGLLFFFMSSVTATAAASSTPASPEEEEAAKEKSEAYVIFDINEAGGDIDFTDSSGTKTALASGNGEIRYSSGDESGLVSSFPGGFEYKRSAAKGKAAININAAEGKVISSVAVSKDGNEQAMDMKENAGEYTCSVNIENETTIVISFSEKGVKKDEDSGNAGKETAEQNAGSGNTADESVARTESASAAKTSGAALGRTTDESVAGAEGESSEEKKSEDGLSGKKLSNEVSSGSKSSVESSSAGDTAKENHSERTLSEQESSGQKTSKQNASEQETDVSAERGAGTSAKVPESGSSGGNVREKAETSSAVSTGDEKVTALSGDKVDAAEASGTSDTSDTSYDASEETFSVDEESQGAEEESLSYGITGKAESSDGVITTTVRAEHKSVKDGKYKGQNMYSTVYGEKIAPGDYLKASDGKQAANRLYSEVAYAIRHGAMRADETAEEAYSAGNAAADYFMTQVVIWGLIHQDQTGYAEKAGMSGVDISSLTGSNPEAESMIGRIKALYNAAIEAAKDTTDGWLPVQYTVEEPESTLLTEKTENGKTYYVSDTYTMKEVINGKVYTEKGTFTASPEKDVPEGTEIVQQNKVEETEDGYVGNDQFYFRIPAESLSGSGTVRVQLTIPAMNGYAALFKPSGGTGQSVFIWGGSAKKEQVVSAGASYDCPEAAAADSYQAEKSGNEQAAEGSASAESKDTKTSKTETIGKNQEKASADSSKNTEISSAESIFTDAPTEKTDAVSRAAISASEAGSRADSSVTRTESVETGDHNPLFLFILIAAGAVTALMVSLIIAAGRKDVTGASS